MQQRSTKCSLQNALSACSISASLFLLLFWQIQTSTDYFVLSFHFTSSLRAELKQTRFFSPHPQPMNSLLQAAASFETLHFEKSKQYKCNDWQLHKADIHITTDMTVSQQTVFYISSRKTKPPILLLMEKQYKTKPKKTNKQKPLNISSLYVCKSPSHLLRLKSLFNYSTRFVRCFCLNHKTAVAAEIATHPWWQTLAPARSTGELRLPCCYAAGTKPEMVTHQIRCVFPTLFCPLWQSYWGLSLLLVATKELTCCLTTSLTPVTRRVSLPPGPLFWKPWEWLCV